MGIPFATDKCSLSSGHDFLRRECPLMALSGHALVHCTCPLSGVKRTCPLHCEMSAFDPKRTFDSVTECPRQKQTLSANFMKFGIKAFYMGRA